jgi:hypothetical protein
MKSLTHGNDPARGRRLAAGPGRGARRSPPRPSPRLGFVSSASGPGVGFVLTTMSTRRRFVLRRARSPAGSPRRARPWVRFVRPKRPKLGSFWRRRGGRWVRFRFGTPRRGFVRRRPVLPAGLAHVPQRVVRLPLKMGRPPSQAHSASPLFHQEGCRVAVGWLGSSRPQAFGPPDRAERRRGRSPPFSRRNSSPSRSFRRSSVRFAPAGHNPTIYPIRLILGSFRVEPRRPWVRFRRRAGPENGFVLRRDRGEVGLFRAERANPRPPRSNLHFPSRSPNAPKFGFVFAAGSRGGFVRRRLGPPARLGQRPRRVVRFVSNRGPMSARTPHLPQGPVRLL